MKQFNTLILYSLICSGVGFISPLYVCADDDFSFEMDEFEKKSLEMGGYIEIKWDHTDSNQNSLLSQLNTSDEKASTEDTLTGSLQLNGSYIKGISSLYWLVNASGQKDNDEWLDSADVFEAYGSIKLNTNINAIIGKKSYKWGKGYAWNPVGFINRSKDPNNPEEALEGYLTTEVDFVKSYSGAFQNVAFTTVILPVWEDVNDNFGKEDHINLAAKLYLLFFDTDIDFTGLIGDSRSSRFGIDFSRNITPNFEIHGEFAYMPELEKVIIESDGSSTKQQEAVSSGLLGIRYLSEFNLTSIIEYYHNGAGYSEEELGSFYQLVEDGSLQFATTGSQTILQRAKQLSLQGYTKPSLGTDYLYCRFSLKEPWDILYMTPALTAIVNLDDQSYSITPEVIYTGFTNWEMKLRFSINNGGTQTEYGEKLNSNKLELRLRYFF